LGFAEPRVTRSPKPSTLRFALSRRPVMPGLNSELNEGMGAWFACINDLAGKDPRLEAYADELVADG
jgi:hypothetical protein